MTDATRSALPARMLAVIVDGPNGCWLWTRSTKYGYGTVTYTAELHGTRRKSPWLVHRLVWTLIVGPIPPSMDLHHRCHTRACVNPAHCEPVARGAEHHQKHLAMRPYCGAGHEWTPENTWMRGSKRVCRKCKAAVERKRRAADPARHDAAAEKRRQRRRHERNGLLAAECARDQIRVAAGAADAAGRSPADAADHHRLHP